MASAFAGPLCRYYAGRDGDALARVAGVEAWRRDLAEALGARLGAQLDWREDPAMTGCEADLGAAGWKALRLFALYAERTDCELPDVVPALLELDRAWRQASDQKFATSRYGHLLACRLWLPGDFAATVRAPLPEGEAAEIGSLAVLVAQLDWLNRRTFQAGDDEVAGWRALPAEAGGPLLPAAQRGFAQLFGAALWAKARRLPLLVAEP